MSKTIGKPCLFLTTLDKFSSFAPRIWVPHRSTVYHLSASWQLPQVQK